MALDTRYRRTVRRLLRLAAPALRLLLRTPAHRLVSGRLILLSVTGWRTGTVYTFPVGYRRDGDQLKVISANRWWRNLHPDPVPVTVWWRGRRHQTTAFARHGDQAVVAELAEFLTHSPALARMYGISREPGGDWSPEQLRAAARHVSVTYLRLPQPS